MSPLLLAILAFVGVTALVGGGAMLVMTPETSRVSDRLDILTGVTTAPGAKDPLKDNSVLSRPLDEAPNLFAKMLERFGNFELLFEQADTTLTISKLAIVSLVLGLAACAAAIALHCPAGLAPLAGIAAGSLPIFWIYMRRGKRMKAFGTQLPDALEMIARALRAGQSLAFGFNAVASEMPAPIGKEFARVYEEQNLGVGLEDSLRTLCKRMPNLDLQFFVTAVVLQRQTGGDLSEILDKIGALIRDRFRILGQVQALTGEGRLSGVVLMALPLVLFVAVYQLNPTYVSMLWTDPMGKKMLAVAIFMQVLGAVVIKKIVDIKV